MKSKKSIERKIEDLEEEEGTEELTIVIREYQADGQGNRKELMEKTEVQT